MSLRARRDAAPPPRELEELATELGRGRITRQQFLARALALGLTAAAIGPLVAACGAEQEPAAASPTPLVPEKPPAINLYNWAEYMPRELLKKFEKRTGIEVAETYYDDNEAMLAKFKAGVTDYDVCVPSDYMVHILLKSGLIQPLHMELLPNFETVLPQFRRPPFDPEDDGLKYSVPYDWGTTGISVRLDKVKEEVTSWTKLWDTAYEGEIQMLNDEREVLGATMKMLGYSYNSTSQEELDEAVAKDIAQKPLVRAYDSNNQRRAVVSGTPLVQGWSGWLLMAYDEVGPEKMAYVLPSEGYCMYVDCMSIPVGAKSPYGAHLFIDFVLEPENYAQLVNYTWYSPAYSAAIPMIDDIVMSFVPDDETLKRGEQLDDLGEAARMWSEAWRQVKSA